MRYPKFIITKDGHFRLEMAIFHKHLLKQMMVHEMIHHYVHTIDSGSFDGIFQHRRHFIRQTRRLKKQFGYEVSSYYPYWYFKNDKNKDNVTLSSRITHLLGNKLHLF